MATFKRAIENYMEAAWHSPEFPWPLNHIRIHRAWDVTMGEGSVVCIVDSGCNQHVDLTGQIIDGRNFTVDNGGDPLNYTDLDNHGTGVAGIVASRIHGTKINNYNIGVAPKTKLLIAKVLDSAGLGTEVEIIQGVEWATAWRGPNGEKVDVINMSFTSPDDIPTLRVACQAAIAAGISIVAAAGNAGTGGTTTSEINYPAAWPEIISVSAISSYDGPQLSWATNDFIDLAAPGLQTPLIMETTYSGSTSGNGTSIAAPHVAGALALIVSAFRKMGLEPTEMEKFNQLITHIRPLTGASPKAVGRGALDFAFGKLPQNPPGTVIVEKEVIVEKIVEVEKIVIVETGGSDILNIDVIQPSVGNRYIRLDYGALKKLHKKLSSFKR